jgi:hypothetical protein
MTPTPPTPTMPKAPRALKVNSKKANPSLKSKKSVGVAKPAPSSNKRQGVNKHKSLAPDKKTTRKVGAASVDLSEHERVVAAKASTTVRQPVAMPTLHDCYLHTHLKKLSRRAQLKACTTFGSLRKCERRSGICTSRILGVHSFHLANLQLARCISEASSNTSDCACA